MKAILCKGIRIRSEEFGGVLQIRDRGAFKVSHIGLEILSQIQEGSDIDEIIKKMQEKYEETPHKIEKDIHKFVQTLVNEGVVEIEGE